MCFPRMKRVHCCSIFIPYAEFLRRLYPHTKSNCNAECTARNTADPCPPKMSTLFGESINPVRDAARKKLERNDWKLAEETLRDDRADREHRIVQAYKRFHKAKNNDFTDSSEEESVFPPGDNHPACPPDPQATRGRRRCQRGTKRKNQVRHHVPNDVIGSNDGVVVVEDRQD